jgi:hypothetical protein
VKQGYLMAPVFAGELVKKIVFYFVFEGMKWWRRLN